MKRKMEIDEYLDGFAADDDFGVDFDDDFGVDFDDDDIV